MILFCLFELNFSPRGTEPSVIASISACYLLPSQHRESQAEGTASLQFYGSSGILQAKEAGGYLYPRTVGTSLPGQGQLQNDSYHLSLWIGERQRQRAMPRREQSSPAWSTYAQTQPSGAPGPARGCPPRLPLGPPPRSAAGC